MQNLVTKKHHSDMQGHTARPKHRLHTKNLKLYSLHYPLDCETEIFHTWAPHLSATKPATADAPLGCPSPVCRLPQQTPCHQCLVQAAPTVDEGRTPTFPRVLLAPLLQYMLRVIDPTCSQCLQKRHISRRPRRVKCQLYRRLSDEAHQVSQRHKRGRCPVKGGVRASPHRAHRPQKPLVAAPQALGQHSIRWARCTGSTRGVQENDMALGHYQSGVPAAARSLSAREPPSPPRSDAYA